VNAQVVLTSSESKRLIAKAVAQMDSVKRAMKKGKILIARGTTNAFVVEELTGRKMEKATFTAGYISPAGLATNPKIPKPIVLVDGQPRETAEVWGDDVVKDMEPGDLIIKGANAIGPDWIPGLLCARAPKSTGGTLGKFQITAMTRAIEVIIPVGLEKMIPISVLVAAKETYSSVIDQATGYVCSLIPMFGTVVTEIEAVKLLSGAEAVPIAAGGVDGAEGSITLQIKGSDASVKKAMDIMLKIKGEPPVRWPK